MKASLFIITTSFVIAFSLPCMAEKIEYDLPSNIDFSEQSFEFPYQFLRFDRGLITLSHRLVRWSEYSGKKTSDQSISPDRMVWESLRKYCQLDSLGNIKYYFSARDAETMRELTPKYVETTNKIQDIAPWAPDYKCGSS